ncbi:hypothetical protein BGW36DRAFT_432078 [Talaromyces proteolyticus]|uniref:GPI anchored protein n=1 Tax=Talaromyces proteolyticus TaxID=1131652 RepID=A0AAD4KG46_9EURO|nr:uncharacterized protein BGW36DRAFT_432078 [Talaromyces proteolyticus]KAH8691528.1 hypothetical protein BGW36DRAFT_432078 [Talaromyces proteolyticus]
MKFLHLTAVCGILLQCHALGLRGLESVFEKRQSIAPGSPLYECHSNCGNVIVLSRTNNYCSNSTFIADLDACLKCALTEDIWQDYGNHVAAAAKACGDDATPSPSSATGAASATVTGSVVLTTQAAATTTQAAVTATQGTVTAPAATRSSSAVSTPTPGRNSTAPSSSTSSPASPVHTGAALAINSDYKWSIVMTIAVLTVCHAFI